ncbi:MAG: fused MFS/spermidine synthase [Bacteroidota bacterium]
MKPLGWKRWLSYLFELPIEQTSSEHNPLLQVLLSRGRYQLCTENAVYSFEDLYDNFYRAFRQIKIEQLPIQNVLILGLGLGSIPRMLERNFHLNFHYTAIELDEEVIYLANKYVLQHLSSPIEIICTDALAYLAQNDQQFDLICMDIFLDDTVPTPFEQVSFLEQLKNALAPDGTLLYNRLAATTADQERSRAFFEGPFRAVFPEGRLLEVLPNYVLRGREEEGRMEGRGMGDGG